MEKSGETARSPQNCPDYLGVVLRPPTQGSYWLRLCWLLGSLRRSLRSERPLWIARRVARKIPTAAHLLLPKGFVTLHVLMPNMTGPALASAAARLFPDLPVLYVSGHLGDDATCIPAAAYIPKPFTPAQFLSQVEAIVPKPDGVSPKQ